MTTRVVDQALDVFHEQRDADLPDSTRRVASASAPVMVDRRGG